MSASTKCRAKNPATCTNPNCPAKRGQQAALGRNLQDLIAGPGDSTYDTMILWGKPGTGKTQSLKQYAAENNLDIQNLTITETHEQTIQDFMDLLNKPGSAPIHLDERTLPTITTGSQTTLYEEMPQQPNLEILKKIYGHLPTNARNTPKTDD